MARYTFSSKMWFGLLLFCISFMYVLTELEASDGMEAMFNEHGSSDHFDEDKSIDDITASSNDELGTAGGKADDDVNLDEDSFSEIDGETGDDDSFEDSENLINGQPVDIVHKFNINDFGEGNMTGLDGNATFAANLTSLNATHGANLTINNSSKPNIRWPCKPYTILSTNESLSPSVVIINNETTLGNVISSMNGTKECGVMLFYSPYCEFCTNLAPLYNAVGRSYSNLIVIASDAQKVMGMSARYGIVGIPTILLFYSGKAVAKYNRTRTVNDFEQFLKELTGLTPTIGLNITSDDELGPISSTPKESRDYYLIFSVSFVLVFVVGKLLGTCLLNLCMRVCSRVKSLFKREKID